MCELDLTALSRAESKFGLERPVSYQVTEGLLNPMGDAEHDGNEIDKYHIIRIRPRFMNDIKIATGILWHELTHARQLCNDFAHDTLAMGVEYMSQLEKVGCVGPSVDGGYSFQISDLYLFNFPEWYKRYKNIPMEKEANKMASCMGWRYPLVR